MAKLIPKAHKPSIKTPPRTREVLLGTSSALGSLSKTAANLARQFNHGAGVVARKR